MPQLSIIIPTRERARYLSETIRTCLASPLTAMEVVVVDNASTDQTRERVLAIDDPRLRYERSEARLSMRDNFERGLSLAKGEVLCFLGDDDGLLSFAPSMVLELMDRHGVDAVSTRRAHYGWPDLRSNRRGTALVPRSRDVTVHESREALRRLLSHDDYYRMPCAYHGFTKRHLFDRIKARQGRFFLSNQVDIYSSIALSMENIRFAYSEMPLVINGGSERSNGASHFGGGSEAEKANWKKEDELGFLPGFEDFSTLGSVIIESALRYCAAHPGVDIDDIFDRRDMLAAMQLEKKGRSLGGKDVNALGEAFAALGMDRAAAAAGGGNGFLRSRAVRLLKSFYTMSPIDMNEHGVSTVSEAAAFMERRLYENGTALFAHPVEEMRVASRLAFG